MHTGPIQRILIVDDSRSIRKSLHAALEGGFDGEILAAGSLKETRTLLEGLDPASFPTLRKAKSSISSNPSEFPSSF